MLPRWRASVPGQTGSEHGAIGRFCSRLSPSLESVQTAERPRLQPAGLEHSLFPSTKAAFFLFRLRMVQASIMDTRSDALSPPSARRTSAPGRQEKGGSRSICTQARMQEDVETEINFSPN